MRWALQSQRQLKLREQMARKESYAEKELQRSDKGSSETVPKYEAAHSNNKIQWIQAKNSLRAILLTAHKAGR